MQNLMLFCQNCAEFLDPGDTTCACGIPRAPGEVITPNGEPLWKAISPGQPVGDLTITPSFVALGLNDRWSGKVVLINRENGSLYPSFSTHNPLWGGIIAGNEVIFGVTSGLTGYDGSAQLFCLAYSQQDGWVPQWPASVGLPDNPASRPVLLHDTVYILCRNGCLTLVNSQTGYERMLIVSGLDSPARWLKTYDQRMLIICDNGQVCFIQPETGRVYPKPIYSFGFSPIRAPEIFGNWLCGIGEDYQIRVVDLRTGNVITLPLSVSKILAEPYIENERLYIGGSDHRLHAIDLPSGALAWQSNEQRHSVVARPITGMGLVTAAVNQVGVVAFDPQNGKEVWQFPISGQPQTFAPLAFNEGVFYATTYKGVTYAVPWHGSSYLKTAQWLQAQGDMTNAGTAMALAYWMCSERLPGLLNDALELWRSSKNYAWAAQLGEKTLEPSDKSIAEDFEQAANHTKDRSKQPLLLNKAKKWYENAGDETSVERIRKKIARIRAPYVLIKAVNIPQECEACTNHRLCVISLENRGTDTAHKIWVRSGGNCVSQRFWMDLQPYLPNGLKIDDIPIEIEIPFAPICSGNLEVLVRCEDSSGNRYEFHMEFSIHVKPFNGVEVFGDIGFLDAYESKIRVHGMVGMIKMQNGDLSS